MDDPAMPGETELPMDQQRASHRWLGAADHGCADTCSSGNTGLVVDDPDADLVRPSPMARTNTKAPTTGSRDDLADLAGLGELFVLFLWTSLGFC